MVRKSKGCQTCKLRKIRCDERKPDCQKCISSRRQCIRGGETPQVIGDMSFKIRYEHKMFERKQNPGKDMTQQDEDRDVSLLFKENGDLLQSICNESDAAFDPLLFSQLDKESQAPSSSLAQYYLDNFAPLLSVKDPKWGSARYHYLHIAKESPALTAALVAVASLQRCSTSGTLPIIEPLEHYQRAIEVFGTLMESRSCSTKSLLVACYFLCLFEIRLATRSMLQQHLVCAKFLITAEVLEECQHPTLESALLSQMISRLAIFDVKAMASGLSDGSLYAKLEATNQLPMLDRNGVNVPSKGYGSEYPTEELTDDLEHLIFSNLVQELFKVMYAINCMKRHAGDDRAEVTESQIWNHISSIKTEYSIIFLLAHRFAQMPQPRRRLVWTALHASAWLAALCIYLERTCRTTKKPSSGTMDHVDSIFSWAMSAVAVKPLAVQQLSLIQLGWPLFMAAIETESETDFQWALDRFLEMKHLSYNMSRMADLLISLHDLQNSRGQRVDIVEVMQQTTGLFVLV